VSYGWGTLDRMNLLAALLLLVGLAAGAALGLLLARATAATLASERDAALAGREEARAARDVADQRAAIAQTECARLAATLDHERVTSAEKLQLLQASQAKLAEQFKVLSAEALAANNQQFLVLANERLSKARSEAAGDLDQRRQAVESLVEPLREALGKVETQLLSVEKDRTSAYAALRTQVEQMQSTSEQLRVETATLVNALRAPQVRGRWGELQLRRVVEAAGMVEHCDFVEQESAVTDDGVLRPDLVVKIAGGKQVIVDAKVPFAGYLEAMEARDDATREARLRAHARHLRDHVDRLSAKSYWERFEASPEFVVLFVPADAFLNAALEQEPALLEYAFERNVVIATPSNLIALLRTVGYAWRQEALAANAAKVFGLGRELHGRLATMGGHLSRLGGQLESAVKCYNQTVSSMESRVLVTARRFSELKVTDTELFAPDQVAITPREVQAPELVASANDALVALPEANDALVARPEAAGPAPAS
jgi:DNA recombination protein RmuC